MKDFLIIGGGVAGLSAAAHLAQFGSVVLLEAEQSLGYHASGRSAALFEPNYGNAPVRVLTKASEAAFRKGNYLSPRGFLVLGTAGEDTAFERDLNEIDCDEISVDAALDLVPILRPSHITRAAYHACAEDIDTDKLLQDFSKTIRAHNGEIRLNARVTELTRDTDAWRAVAAGEVIKAQIVINAAGPWADHVAQMAGLPPIGLVPHRRSMARIKAPGGHDVSAWPIFFGAGEAWYAKPDAGQLIVSPADEDPVPPGDAWPDDMVLAEGIARYQDFVTEDVTRPTSTWAGLRTFAPDRSLVLGRDPQEPSFVWSAGQGGYGFQTGPAAGRLVAALAIGDSPEFEREVLLRLSPARFR